MLAFACLDYLLHRDAPGMRDWLLEAAFHEAETNDFVRLAFERAVINGQSAARDSLDQFATLCALAYRCPSGAAEETAENETLRLLTELSDLLSRKLTEAIQEQLSDPKWWQDLAFYGQFRSSRAGRNAWAAYAAEAQDWCDDRYNDLLDVFARHVSPDSGETLGDVDVLIAGLLKAWRGSRKNPMPAMARATPA